ncbi:fused response regulator/phosphatase [Aliivibrio sifiae]|nr:fused response regulator/phosphatase [Aliivibrio sifiae]
MTNSILLFEDTQAVSLDSVRVLRQSLSKILDSLDTQQTFKHQCLLCFSEWSTNLVLHPKQPSDVIAIALRKTTQHWQLDVYDTGEPWDPTTQHTNENLSNFSLKCGGRGIDIIQDQTDEMIYSSSDKNNMLTMKWERAAFQKKHHILIVEDDAIFRMLYQAYLEKEFTITTKNNGEEALEFLNHETVDLIISDIQMPKMSGLELRAQLEKKDTFVTPFIFLSRLQDAHTLQNANQLGIDDYLEKSIQKEQLLHSINRVLARFEQVYKSLSQRVNQKITHSLLPNTELDSTHWSIATQQRNTGHGGGDFLLSRTEDDISLLLLADVMGHDESAKFFAYAYAGYVRGLMQNADITQPAQLLSQLSNNAFKDHLLSQTMLTSCCLSFISNDTIKISSAGHPAPLHISPSGLSSIDIQGTLPGLLPITEYQEQTLTLKQGERLALFTDGLFESGNTVSERETLERTIKTTLLATVEKPIEEALEQVMQCFDKLAGTPPNDDALLLLIERNN